jgi:hypothetical protein
MRPAGLTLLLAAALVLCTASASAVPPKLTVVAAHLDNPRKLFVAADGAVYVAEAGAGGRETCLGSGSQAACVGLTGSVTRVVGGRAQRVLDGLPSVAHRDGTQAEGPADVEVHGDSYAVLLMDAAVTPRGTNRLGPAGALLGSLVSSHGGKAAPSVVVNLAAFEAARNPDHGAGPGARYGDPPVDSDPYAFVRYRSGYAVVDAAANDLLWIGGNGTVKVLAVFPTRREPLPPAARRRIGAPAGMSSIVSQSVPSSVAVGPDGALYVGELTGVPFRPGSARVWRVVPGSAPAVYASGFTTISDLAFSGKDLLVLELTTKGLFGARSPGALIRVRPGHGRSVLASRGLAYPTGVAVVPGAIYVADNGLSPGSGRPPHGRLLRLTTTGS